MLTILVAVWFFVFWLPLVIIGVQIIKSGHIELKEKAEKESSDSNSDKEKKKKKKKTEGQLAEENFVQNHQNVTQMAMIQPGNAGAQ